MRLELCVGWQRWVASLEHQIFCAKEPWETRALFQRRNRPSNIGNLLIDARLDATRATHGVATIRMPEKFLRISLCCNELQCVAVRCSVLQCIHGMAAMSRVGCSIHHVWFPKEPYFCVVTFAKKTWYLKKPAHRWHPTATATHCNALQHTATEPCPQLPPTS